MELTGHRVLSLAWAAMPIISPRGAYSSSCTTGHVLVLLLPLCPSSCLRPMPSTTCASYPSVSTAHSSLRGCGVGERTPPIAPPACGWQAARLARNRTLYRFHCMPTAPNSAPRTARTSPPTVMPVATNVDCSDPEGRCIALYSVYAVYCIRAVYCVCVV